MVAGFLIFIGWGRTFWWLCLVTWITQAQIVVQQLFSYQKCIENIKIIYIYTSSFLSYISSSTPQSSTTHKVSKLFKPRCNTECKTSSHGTPVRRYKTFTSRWKHDSCFTELELFLWSHLDYDIWTYIDHNCMVYLPTLTIKIHAN